MSMNVIINKALILFFVLPLALHLTGCERWEKDRLVKAANTLGYEESLCYSTKVMPDDCKNYDVLLKELELKAKLFISKYSLDEEQIRDIVNTSVQLGRSRVQASSNESIYRRVYRAYSKTPYYYEREKIFTRGGDGLDLDDVNYAIFTKRCTEYADEVFYQRFTHFRTRGESGLSYDVYFNKLNGSCFNVEQLQDDFIILTEKQLERYSNIRGIFGHRVINVLKFDTWDEAKAAVELRRASAQNNN